MRSDRELLALWRLVAPLSAAVELAEYLDDPEAVAEIEDAERRLAAASGR